MKGKLIIVAIGMIYSSFGCTLGIIDGTLKTSRSIAESKEDNFYVSEYTVVQEPEGLFKIKEAWEEKAWGYEVHNLFKAEKALLDSQITGLLFTIDTTGAKYSYSNFADWSLIEKSRDRYVGNVGWVLHLSLQDNLSTDTIKLVLVKNLAETEKIVGTLTFIRKH